MAHALVDSMTGDGMDGAKTSFAARVLCWWRRHGRRDLPWQHRPTPYRVWVSEIMLQQTQVATVIPYYQRFMRRFPGVRALADAPLDDVLGHWSGLGYYARARNMHRSAGIIRDRHGGRFPRDLDSVMALPGIGRSTAGAILSLALDQPHAILDGNVKRVLCRHAGVDGWPGRAPVQRALWSLADDRLPDTGYAAYTQAMMDLGATVCTARSPACTSCPVRADCVAFQQGRTQALPAAKPRRTLPRRSTLFVLARDDRGAVLLVRRAPVGIWGGLWCPPQVDDRGQVDGTLAGRGLQATAPGRTLPPVTHTFSHFRLEITPLLVPVRPDGEQVADRDDQCWLLPAELRTRDGLGLAAPVARLVASLACADHEGADHEGKA